VEIPLGRALLARVEDNYKEEIIMIYGVVSVRVKAGKFRDWLELFKSNAIRVRQEKGCIQYIPVVDIDVGLPIQALDKNVITILETWESLEVLRDHLAAPHMAAYFEKEKDLVEGVSLKMLQET
jgi:quinol monooxygenase YgiN